MTLSLVRENSIFVHFQLLESIYFSLGRSPSLSSQTAPYTHALLSFVNMPTKKDTETKCLVLKKLLLEFYPTQLDAKFSDEKRKVSTNKKLFDEEKHAFEKTMVNFLVNFKAVNNYYFLFEKYSADPTCVGKTEGEMFKVIFAAKRDNNGNVVHNYNIGDVVCVDTAANNNNVDVCFNVHKEPIEQYTMGHIKYLFNSNAVLDKQSDFYKGYLFAMKELSGDNTPNVSLSTNASRQIRDLEEQLATEKEETENVKQEFKGMSDYIAELEKWIENVRKETAKLPNRLFQKLNPK